MFKNIIMRKNGSRLISFSQYRLVDLIIFAVVLAVSELVVFVASKSWFKGDAYYYVSFAFPIALLILVRWGVWSAGNLLIGGVLQAAFYGKSWVAYICYPLGYISMLLLLLPLKYLGRDRVKNKWYFACGYTLLGWLILNFISAAMSGIIEGSFLSHLVLNFGFGTNGLLTEVLAILVICIARKIEGLFEFQKTYLLKLDAERKQAQHIDEFGEKPIEMDEESLDIILDRKKPN